MKKGRQKLNSTYRTWIIILVLVISAILVLNAILMRRTESERIEIEGQMRLSSIAGRVDNSLYRSECLLNSVAMQLEQIISMGGDTSALLQEYFSAETNAEITAESDGSCFSAYAAYNGRLYIYDFVPDNSFTLDERSWYVGAKRRLGQINVTDPYIDASTGEMCYSMSKVLSDGTTVVGLDFNLSSVQSYIEEMTPEDGGTSLIVSGGGMIVGHSEPELVGEYAGNLEFYKELVNKSFMLYGNSFDYNADGIKYNVFSDKTNYDWYLIVCVSGNDVKSAFSVESMLIAIIMAAFSVVLVIFLIRTYRSKQAVETELSNRVELMNHMTAELKRPLTSIMSRADILSGSGGAGSKAGTEIQENARELNHLLDNLSSMSAIHSESSCEKSGRKKVLKSINHKRKIALITSVLFAATIFALVLNTYTQMEWGNTKMQKETEIYLNQVQDWVSENKAVLEVISHSIAAQPGFEQDYDAAVTYLDNVVSKYDDISVAYLCNPEWEHTVIMNNRWEPDNHWHVEERQWYIDTLASKTNFSISEPYLDEQTGYYCTTLSTIVYDDMGNLIGLLGIDYYLDKLIGILGASYTDTGYAFLTDIDGNILNHPFDEYQMKPGYSVNAANLIYREALSESRTMVLKDYDGKNRVCLALTEEDSGFKVIVMREIGEIYGNAITSDILYVVVFALCIIIINVIMRRLTQWQIKVNNELQEAAEKAISAGKAKNNFLANMSHEIRTPINAVLGMNEMIMRESTEESVKEYASNIQSAGRTLLSIINEILDFSKIESGKMEIVPVEYDTASLINDIVNMIKPRAEKKGLSFTLDIDESMPAVMYGDDVRIRQIITNILTNAVKYTPTGSVHFIMKGKEKAGGILKLEVSISDTGIGIKEEDLNKLFTSFQRLDQEKNRNIEGTGLGITIVQRLLNMMDSELQVTSVYGEGSTFSFVVEQKIISDEPVGDFAKCFRASEDNMESCYRTAPNARIMVVDDNDTNLVVARSLLKRTEVQLKTAGSGRECIELLRNHAFDIVFLDHMMPEMDGIETLGKIKEEKLSGRTVFVALTANAIHGARQQYMEAGFDDYLSKPFTGNDIERCIFNHLPESLIKTIKEQTHKTSTEKPSESSTALLAPEKGMQYCGGNKSAYIEVLDIYARSSKDKIRQIKQHLAEKNWKDYTTEVHALKSTSFTIGADSLGELARQLEQAGKEENTAFIEGKTSKMLAMYRLVVEEAREYCAASAEEAAAASVPTTPISAKRLEIFVADIKAACEAFDGDLINEVCNEAAQYTIGETSLKPLFERVREASDNFEYEAAAELAESILTKI